MNTEKFHNVKNLTFSDDTMSLTIDDQRHEFDLKEHSKRLLNANGIQRTTFEIEESGYGIHWPLIDEDLSIDGLLGIHHEPPAGFNATAKVNA